MMNLIKAILSIQLLLAFLCLLIQVYALVSAKWAIFESRIELGNEWAIYLMNLILMIRVEFA